MAKEELTKPFQAGVECGKVEGEKKGFREAADLFSRVQNFASTYKKSNSVKRNLPLHPKSIILGFAVGSAVSVFGTYYLVKNPSPPMQSFPSPHNNKVTP